MTAQLRTDRLARRFPLRLRVAAGDALHTATSLAPRVLATAFQLSIFYIAALQLFPELMSPGGELWALLVLWACSYFLGETFDSIGLPKALGMLVAGLALVNFPSAEHLPATESKLNKDWSRDFRACAMALVLLRAGLGIDLRTVQSYGFAIPTMAILPSVCESLLGAAVAQALIGMPFLLAWVMSFIISAVGPAIVTAGCSSVKERGFAPAAPNFLMTCSCFDDATCIIGFNCLLHAFIPGPGNVGYQYAIGPLNLVLGITGGLIAGAIASLTVLWRTPVARVVLLFSMGMAMILVAERNGLLGAGALANLVFGLGTRAAWQRGWPRAFNGALLSKAHRGTAGHKGAPEGDAAADRAAALAATSAHMLKHSLRALYFVWNVVFYPLLFGLVGTLLNISQTTPRTGKIAVGYAFFAVGVRFLVTLFVVAFVPVFQAFTPKERVFMSLSWISKATTQAAFATTPLLAIQAWVTAHPGESYGGVLPADLLAYGDQIKWACVLSIFVGTPLGTIFMNNAAPYLLKRETLPTSASAGHGGAAASAAEAAAAAAALSQLPPPKEPLSVLASTVQPPRSSLTVDLGGGGGGGANGGGTTASVSGLLYTYDNAAAAAATVAPVEMLVLPPPGSFRGAGGGALMSPPLAAASAAAFSSSASASRGGSFRRRSLGGTAAVEAAAAAAAAVAAAGGAAPSPPRAPPPPHLPPPPIAAASSTSASLSSSPTAAPTTVAQRTEASASASCDAAPSASSQPQLQMSPPLGDDQPVPTISITYSHVLPQFEDAARALLLQANAPLARLLGGSVRLDVARAAHPRLFYEEGPTGDLEGGVGFASGDEGGIIGALSRPDLKASSHPRPWEDPNSSIAPSPPASVGPQSGFHAPVANIEGGATSFGGVGTSAQGLVATMTPRRRSMDTVASLRAEAAAAAAAAAAAVGSSGEGGLGDSGGGEGEGGGDESGAHRGASLLVQSLPGAAASPPRAPLRAPLASIPSSGFLAAHAAAAAEGGDAA